MMQNIYYYNSDFDRNVILDRMSEIDSKLDEEQNKPADERDREREFNLIYQKFMEGLKLSTGYF